MPTDDSGFWAARKRAAEFKHDVVRHQLGAFTGKTGSRAPDQRVAFLDGYAGPGAYENKDPGSPMIAVTVAMGLRKIRNLDGYFIELRARNARKLRVLLDENGFPHWKVLRGTCAEHLPGVLNDVGDAPLLVFVDPYGLGIPFDQLVDQVLSRPRGTGYNRTRITEVILHFSLSGLRRMGGFLDKDYSNVQEDEHETQRLLLEDFDDVDDDEDEDESMAPERVQRRLRQQLQALRSMDDFLGGDWWRDVKRSYTGGDWREEVLRQWIALIRQRTHSWDAFPVPVPHRWDGSPEYYLVLLTQNDAGTLAFIQAVSSAFESLYQDTWEAPAPGTLFAMDAEAAEPPKRGPEYIETIAGNIRAFVKSGRIARVMDVLPKLYGSTLGQARHTHLFKAIQKVAKEQLLARPVPKTDDLETTYILELRRNES